MTSSDNRTPSPARGTRGTRADKREVILRAAIEVFGREGYAGASVDEIARRAGVAKPTLYTRFDDKSTLFTEAVRYASDRSNQAILDVIDTASTHPADLRSELERLGTALVGCVMHDEGAAVMRLQMTEHAAFGAAFHAMRAANRARVHDRLAGKFAQLATAGRLRLTDPSRAARHFFALVSDEALTRSGFGAIPLTAEDVAGPVSDAVDTFLAAFGAESSTPRC